MTLALLGALSAMGYGVMFTVLDDYRDEFGIPAAQLGFIVGLGFVAAFVAQVVLAPIADRGHARRLMVVGVAIDVVGLLVLGFGTTIWVLILGRALSGLGAGMTMPALRRLVIVGDPDRLGDNLGLLLACDVAGFAAGPLLSALLVGPFGLPAPYIVVAVAASVCLPIVLRQRVHDPGVETVSATSFDLLRSPHFRAAVSMGVAMWMMIGTFDALWVVVLDDLGADEWIANIGITVFVVPLIILGERGGRLAQRLGPFRLGPIGLGIGAVAMFAYGLMPTGIAMLAVGVVHAVNDGITVSSTSVAVGLVTPEGRHASAQGLLGGVQTLMAGVAAVVAGVVYDTAGRTTAYAVCSVVMLVLIGYTVSVTRLRSADGGFSG
ncbi:MAG: MFS transporter [Actinomycetota bacterium]|jgi:MFS family permease|nr:MFS transporter [Ilumatobacteraceae bacterium]MDA2960171.1 MFS transporter [Actinomycetota bacterium]MDA3006163.1 MFS transporter [Actinomycetota bacterium]MDA3035406.1 MFS transporter [Actinomycetota bacterium]